MQHNNSLNKKIKTACALLVISASISLPAFAQTTTTTPKLTVTPTAKPVKTVKDRCDKATAKVDELTTKISTNTDSLKKRLDTIIDKIETVITKAEVAKIDATKVATLKEDVTKLKTYEATLNTNNSAALAAFAKIKQIQCSTSPINQTTKNQYKTAFEETREKYLTLKKTSSEDLKTLLSAVKDDLHTLVVNPSATKKPTASQTVKPTNTKKPTPTVKN